MIKISPSILASNFARLGAELSAMRNAGADMIHLDVMDGHFVPNISFGAPVIASLRKVSDMFFDTHLMISDPLKYAEDFAKAGSDRITFHLESDNDPLQVIKKIHGLGAEAGISIKPATEVEGVYPYLDELSQVLIMTVEPGFGGQSFMADMMSKVTKLAEYKKANNLNFDIQVDGGIANDTAEIVASHGANVLVAGSALFSRDNYKQAVDELRAAAQKGLENPLF